MFRWRFSLVAALSMGLPQNKGSQLGEYVIRPAKVESSFPLTNGLPEAEFG
jgi:hypothetical protein